MAYALALLCPPLAILIKGKLVQGILCGIIWLVCLIFGLFFILPAPIGHFISVVWAFGVIGSANADKRQRKLVKALRQP